MSTRLLLRLLLLVLLAVAAPAARAQRTLAVGPGEKVQTIGEAIAQARPGSQIVVRAGVYRESTLVVDKPVTLVADGDVVLDGEGARAIMKVTADGVTVRGFTFRNVGSSFVEDRAALLVEKAARCTIEGNTFEATFFGIYLAETSHCTVSNNTLRGEGAQESKAGNGIHLWYSRLVTIRDNRVTGHRDGIYLEFVDGAAVEGNVSAENLRYGLHFMFADSCRYTRNTFRANGAGVAVMYSKHVEMTGNHFADNWGAAAFGLLLKEITDSRIAGNVVRGNTVGLYAEGVNRVEVKGNDFTRNGWAVRVMADGYANLFTANNFRGNSFDVGTNSRQSSSRFEGNYWDAYRGYDIDRDGVGDVPFRPVRLFSLIVARHEPAILLMRSLLVDLLDLAERVAPVLTPATLTDARPAMQPLAR